MRLFLVRHGETVDNVAQVYAGSRDSELTNHGFQQANRLGRYLYATGHRFSHIFSSHLQRAFRTAELILEAQAAAVSTDEKPLQVRRLPILMEQDFGFYEGKKWYQKPPGGDKSGKQAHRDEKVSTPSFVDMETKDSMAERMDAFLDEHLIPLLDDRSLVDERSVAIVSHGIILSVLWRRLLARLPPKSVSPSVRVLETYRSFQLENLGGWSNTGYLELLLQKQANSPPQTKVKGDSSTGPEMGLVKTDEPVEELSPKVATARILHEWTAVIETVNGKNHLQGLKRTGAGVGSAKYDAGQKTLDTFFKRRRIS
ncbi:phosphoglycerate mutase-like protein [Mytilinidion resinicola]|uniref:Phosphoglycerate mutase-like protein n=1 Tax=Mytilinidion resinicola TaxID=574789 RepID=A0A6A6Y6Z3_9PEZI|nr:phosphoglycerate mutase-like protein [Mytilinidion resinicola]KAF2803577.1 phosphoglycerate mutase-like protein [Mytilinidion resinicola]